MTNFEDYLSSEELDIRTKKFIINQGKELFNEIQSLKYIENNINQLENA